MVPQNGSKPSTAKDVLQKLTHLHELPQVILEWRKLNASVTKVVYPMSRAAKLHKGIFFFVFSIFRYLNEKKNKEWKYQITPD